MKNTMWGGWRGLYSISSVCTDFSCSQLSALDNNNVIHLPADEGHIPWGWGWLFSLLFPGRKSSAHPFCTWCPERVALFLVIFKVSVCLYVYVCVSRSVMSDSLQPHGPQASLSMEFFRQEYWRGLPSPPPGDLPNPGIKPHSPALQADSLPLELPGKPQSAWSSRQ